jgi:hypothetical protein
LPPSPAISGSTLKLGCDEEEEDSPKRKYVFIGSDDECEGIDEESSSAYKKMKLDMPEVVAKKNTDKPLPCPFPLPSNCRPEVELCLKNKRMTTEAMKNFHSSVASAMFSYKRYHYYFVTMVFTFRII